MTRNGAFDEEKEGLWDKLLEVELPALLNEADSIVDLLDDLPCYFTFCKPGYHRSDEETEGWRRAVTKRLKWNAPLDEEIVLQVEGGPSTLIKGWLNYPASAHLQDNADPFNDGLVMSERFLPEENYQLTVFALLTQEQMAASVKMNWLVDFFRHKHINLPEKALALLKKNENAILIEEDFSSFFYTVFRPSPVSRLFSCGKSRQAVADRFHGEFDQFCKDRLMQDYASVLLKTLMERNCGPFYINQLNHPELAEAIFAQLNECDNSKYFIFSPEIIEQYHLEEQKDQFYLNPRIK